MARITPHTRGKYEKEKKTTIKSAQATLNGIKENSQPSKVPKQSWGMKKNPKDPKILSIKEIQYDDARPSEENKNKKKKPKSNFRGLNRPF